MGQAVAQKSTRPNTYKGYHFAVLDTQELNAFACPGGIIFVTKGLIQTCENEDQLAAVLASFSIVLTIASSPSTVILSLARPSH